MRNANLARERIVWTAVVATLATSASWLAAISVALAATHAGIVSPGIVVAARALLRAAWLLVRGATPVVLVVAFAAAVAALAWAERQRDAARGGAHHA